MKTTRKTGSLSALLVVLALFTAWPAAAHTTRSRPASGVVESLDAAPRTMVFAPAPGQAPRQLVITRQTKFIHDWQFAAAGEVKPGTKAVIYYRVPFFGKPFVTKVVWSNGG
jgi:hypothetical protein